MDVFLKEKEEIKVEIKVEIKEKKGLWVYNKIKLKCECMIKM